MKNLIALAAFLCLFASFAHAQVSITQSDMPVSGDTLRYSRASATGVVLPTVVGQNQTWDFSTLKPILQGVEKYKTALSINPLYVATFGLSAYGRKVADTIGIGGVSATDIYDFYRRNAQSFSSTGRALTVQGLPVSSLYTDPDEIYSFPLTYGRRDSTKFRVQFNIAGQAIYTQAGTRTNTVVGEGRITTPYGAFQAIAVQVSVRQFDTITISQVPIPVIFASTSQTIVWLAQGQKFPILELTISDGPLGSAQVTGVRYRDIYRVIPVSTPEPDFLAVQRNISVGDSVAFFNLTPQTLFTPTYFWGISPSSGWKFTAGTTAGSRNPIIKFTAGGQYSISLSATVDTTTKDIQKNNYISVAGPVATAPKHQQLDFKVYPNPAQDVLYVLQPQGGTSGTWVCTDAQGKQHLLEAEPTETGLRLRVQHLPAGVYTLQAPGIGSQPALRQRIVIMRN